MMAKNNQRYAIVLLLIWLRKVAKKNAVAV
jgi:hypothetical protein